MRQKNFLVFYLLLVIFLCSFVNNINAFEGETRGIKNDKLIQLARGYLYANPTIYVDGKQITSSNKNILAKIKFDPAWFLAHNPNQVEYIYPGKWPGKWDYLNDKFIIYWFYIPGCEQRPNDKINKPNWFDSRGRHCLGGYTISIILDADLHGKRVDIHSVD